MRRPLAAIAIGWCTAGLSAVAAEAVQPEVPPLLDDGDMTVAFQPRSNRLVPSEGQRLDRLAALARSESSKRLVIVVPQPADAAARHFVASRLSVIDEELAKRGLRGERIGAPGPVDGDSAISLRLEDPAPTTTVVEILPATTPPSGPPAAAQPAAAQPAAEPGAGPIPLVPAPPGQPAGQEAATASPPPPPVAVDPLWVAAAGRSLHEVLQDWGVRASWTVVWQSDREYPVEAAASFNGDFVDAASQLVEGFATVAPAPYAHFYKGNQVLVVLSGEGR